jgi:hypothetical protein
MLTCEDSTSMLAGKEVTSMLAGEEGQELGQDVQEDVDVGWRRELAREELRERRLLG